VLQPANGAAFNARHLAGYLVVEKTTTTIFAPPIGGATHLWTGS